VITDQSQLSDGEDTAVQGELSAPATPARFESIFRTLRGSGFGVLIITSIVFVALALSTDSFLTTFNLFNVSRTAGLAMFIALAQMIVLVIGDMNLSVGGIGALVVVAAGVTMDSWALDPWIAVPIALAVGAAAGLANGLLINWTGVNSFVITLGMLFVFQGLVTGITRGFPYTEIPDGFSTLGRGSSFGVANILLLATFCLLLVFLMFRYLVLGRHLLSTGGGKRASERLGVSTRRITLAAHAMSGLFAATAAVLWVSRTASAQPATGSDWLIISFAVAIIGGTALTGGAVSLLGIFSAAWLLALIRNGLIMLNANVYYEQTFLGLLIIAAVAIGKLRATSSQRIG